MTTREQILKAAELIFGTHGYAGSSMRAIAEQAGVAQALLHYHFGTKENLYSAIFDHRSEQISAHRGRLLEQLLSAEPHPTLEQVLAILFTPTEQMAEEKTLDVDAYVQLVAMLGLASDTRSQSLVAKYFDPIATKFIAVFQSAVPGLSAGQAVWCYLFAIGARTQAQALNGRAVRLGAECGCPVPDPTSLLLSFTAAGIRALQRPRTRRSKS